MTVVVLAAEDMAVNLLADMAFVAFADMAVDKEPVVDDAVGMVDADHTAQVLGKTVAAVDRVAVVDIAVDMVAADHTVWVLVVEVPAGLVDHSEKKKIHYANDIVLHQILIHLNFIFLHWYKENLMCLTQMDKIQIFKRLQTALLSTAYPYYPKRIFPY